MKAILLVFFSVLIYTASNAQTTGELAKDTTKIIRICAPSRSGMIAPEPLTLVFSHNKTFRIGDIATANIDPKSIKSINILKDSAAIKTYGNAARGGVIQIYLDDDKYPEAYKLLVKKDSVKTQKK